MEGIGQRDVGFIVSRGEEEVSMEGRDERPSGPGETMKSGMDDWEYLYRGWKLTSVEH